MARDLFEVTVYHDETGGGGATQLKGHVLLFVPSRLVHIQETPLFGVHSVEYYPQREFLDEAMRVRSEFHLDKKLHFSDISGKTWGRFDLGIRRIVDLAVDALRQKGAQSFAHPLKMRLAVMFYPGLSDWSVYGGGERKEQRLRHDETILRMLLKGAAHYLYDEHCEITVTSIVSDGDPSHRQLDEERVVWRLAHDEAYGRSPLQENVSLARDARIIHLPSDHKQYEQHSDEYVHANLLQVADLLLGSVIRCCFTDMVEYERPPRTGAECVKKDVVASPVRQMLKKTRRGQGFRHSGHYKSFTVSQIAFSEGSVGFKALRPRELKVDPDTMELGLVQIEGGA